MKLLIEQATEGKNLNTSGKKPESSKAKKSATLTSGNDTMACSSCGRASVLWCPECTTTFCPICWKKVPHHEFITVPDIWKSFEVSNASARMHPKYSPQMSFSGSKPIVKSVQSHTLFTVQGVNNEVTIS
jgi:hypothetical protein